LAISKKDHFNLRGRSSSKPSIAIGSDVVFDTNELLKLFERFRVISYEDTEDVSARSSVR